MPRKKAAETKTSRKSATPQSGKKSAVANSSVTRVSRRSSTVKKIADSKQRRSAGKAASKDRKKPWDESDEEYNHDFFSDIDSDTDNEKAEFVEDESQSDESDMDFKYESPTVFVEDFSERIFCPWAEMEPSKIPPLVLPCSSSDLLIDKDHLFDALEIYEILRAYCHTIQISPFLFEDFCSAIRSTVQSKLLCEIHIALLKILFRDDEDHQTLYSVQETNSSFNILMALIEPMTFGEILRLYVESDPSFSREILHLLNTSNYPFVDLEKRLLVLKFLCERFFDSVVFKELINRDMKKINKDMKKNNKDVKKISKDMKIIHDEHCRDCGRQADDLLCDGCEACYHLKCTNLTELPLGRWLCQICEAHEINGVANCLMPDERDYRFSRRTQPLGYDRHGRIYWFLARRLFVQDVVNKELHYYSSLPQIYELMSALDDKFMEERLFRAIADLLPTIADHMRITLALTDERRKNLQDKMQRECPRPYLHVDNVHRMSQIEADIADEGRLNGEQVNGDLEIKPKDGMNAFKKHTMNTLKELLGIENQHLASSLWSGGCTEQELLEYHNHLENDAAFAATAGKINGVDALEEFQMTLLENLQRGYRLGFSDAEYRNYVNHYSISDFAKSPYIRAKERDRRRYMCSKFSLADEGEFSWVCAKGRDFYGSEQDTARWIQFTIRRLLERLTDNLMHRLWRYEEKTRFQELLQNSLTVETLKRCLLQFECAVRKPIFCAVWWNSLGHTRLVRQTYKERLRRQKIDEAKKKEEKALASADPHDEDFVWVKYSLYKNGPPRHNIWRQKDEQYRVNGRENLCGWMWISGTILRTFVDLPKRPPLGVTYQTPKEALNSREAMQAYYLEKVVKYLSTRRLLNEAVKAARASKPLCYSPSCRLVARGGRALVSALSIQGGDFRSCYSSSCARHFQTESYESSSNQIVKAFKPFRINPYAKEKRTPDLKPEDTPGEGKAFPFPKPFDYKAKKSGKRSILVLPKKALRKLARQGGTNSLTYVPGFHKMAKSNWNVWPYPCLRPLFDNCWRYSTVVAKSLHALALQLRIIYACIRWVDLEPAEKDEEDPRVWTHHIDCDEVRTVISHKEHPPDGYYEQYKMRVERYSLHEDGRDVAAAAGDDDSADYTTTSVKTLRKRKRKNQKAVEEVYVKRRRTSMEEKWIDGVELKLYEINDYWARYFIERRRKFEEFKQKQQLQQQQQRLRLQHQQEQYSPQQQQVIRPLHGTQALLFKQQIRLPQHSLQPQQNDLQRMRVLRQQQQMRQQPINYNGHYHQSPRQPSQFRLQQQQQYVHQQSEQQHYEQQQRFRQQHQQMRLQQQQHQQMRQQQYPSEYQNQQQNKGKLYYY